jgi:membrane dipeptidase
MDRRLFLRAGVFTLAAPFYNRCRFPLMAAETAEYSTRTLDLVKRCLVIDMLGLVTLDFRELWKWQREGVGFEETHFARMKASGITVFHPAAGYNRGDVYRASLRDMRGWNRFIQAHPDKFLRMDAIGDMDRAKATGKIGILLGQQNSSHFRSIDDVDAFYALGQRVSQLSYYRNQIGCGCYEAPDNGLSAYGVDVVRRMNQLGMAVDLSHCGDRTTLDALEASVKPVIITHSNCRSLANHRRCKPDEAIRKMAAKGGVMGITMVRGFVSSRGRAGIEDVLNHIGHVARISGIEHAGIGSDVDLVGRDGRAKNKSFDLDGVRYARKVHEITEGMVRRGYSDAQIELCLGGNFRRVLTGIWRPQAA